MCYCYCCRLKLVDEDISLGVTAPGNSVSDDEDPTVAEVVDERPEMIRKMEEFRSSQKWKTLADGNLT